jgi:hypothetical protein
MNLSKIDISAPLTFAAGGDGSPRTFTGIANSGRPFVYWGAQTVIDLESATYADKVPVLVQHDRSKRAGVGSFDIGKSGLAVSGTLLSNEHGSAIAADSDEGFPWQMSVTAYPARVEKLEATKKTSVNGRQITGPAYILRGAEIGEVSFVVLGADSKTSAQVFTPMNEDEIAEDIGNMTIAQLQDGNPALHDEVWALGRTKGFEEGRAAGVADERSRISGLLSLSLADHHRDAIEVAIKDGSSIEQTAIALLDAEHAMQEQQLDQIRSDRQKPIASPPISGGPDDEGASFEAAVQSAIRGGMSRARAITKVATEQPELHKRWVDAGAKYFPSEVTK